MRRIGFLLWPAGIALGLLSEWAQYRWREPAQWAPDLAVGWTFMACGLIVALRRRQSPSGGLLAATGFAWFIPNFAGVGPAFLGRVAADVLFLHRGPLFHMVLAYPSGRTSSRLTRRAVLAGYAAAILYPVWENDVAVIALATLLIAFTVHQYTRSVGPYRRAGRVALSAAIVLGFLLGGEAIARLALPTGAASGALLHAYEVTLGAIAVGLTAGLLSASWERATVTDLVVELGEARSGPLRDQLARALGDPSLQVGYWVPESAGFVDADGQPFPLPDPGPERSTTRIERDGQPMAVLVHDPAVLGDPGLIEAVSSATKLASSTARLQAEVRTRLAEIKASRRRVLEASDEERGRLERRLHQGAERRLGELADTLRGAGGSAVSRGTIERIAQAESQLARTQEELRRLARGIRPRELSEQGLEGTLASLAENFPLPVDLAVSMTEASPKAEACAYFVCSEALANVAKYASASRVAISVSSTPGALTAEVRDDGVGGADPGRGTGLRGLTDRVETLGGMLTMESPPGLGTRLVAVIPQDAGAA
jgi:signal transduction histidine kinase